MIPLVDADVLVHRACYSKEDFIQTIEYCDLVVSRIFEKFESTPHLFLSGSNNFRYKVATILPYKGNRKKEKPRYYWDIREYLTDYYQAEIVDGMEADDALGIRASPDSVICSNDKDLNQIPGWHYDFTKDYLYYTNQEQSDFYFFKQMLVGDSIDNIPGIKNPEKAHFKNPPNFTNDTASKLLEGKSVREMYEVVYNLHIKQYGNEKAFDEIARLLFLRRANANEYYEYYTEIKTPSVF